MGEADGGEDCTRLAGGGLAGAAASEDESEADDGTAGGGILFFPHPPLTAKAQIRQSIPALGFKLRSLRTLKKSLSRVMMWFFLKVAVNRLG